MKILVSFAFLLFGFVIENPAFAQKAPRTYASASSVISTPVAAYCNETRFESYISLALGMRDYVTPQEYSAVYLPLKIKAARANVTFKTYGALSSTTHAALLDIVKFVNVNQRSFDSLWEVEAFFDVAVDLMEMTQNLSRDLE